MHMLFISFSILCMSAEKALTRLHLCTCSSGPWLLADAVSTEHWVESMTRDPGVAGSNLTGGTALCL